LADTLGAVQHIEVRRSADPALVDEVEELAAEAEDADGFRFLSDHLWLDLHHGGADRFAAAAARDADGRLAAYAQASEANSGLVVESTVAPRHRHRADLEQHVLEALFGHLSTRDATDITWWAHDVAPAHDATAAALGLSPVRGLLQMRRSLPTGLAVEVDTRAFDPARDEESWLTVNNRAFATHGEQGGWDLATLRQRESEDWFDPEGFRIHERDGKMAAFCWTKLHGDHEPPLGEIYVIAVDPAFHGLGLGRQLTLAGLESIYDRGVTTAMLFVDAGNTAAIGLYQALGFETHRTDRAYSVRADPTANQSEDSP
jgi:mycothiol synthase